MVGLFGALASMSGQERPKSKALGIATPALIVGVGPALWLLSNGRHLDCSRLIPAAPVFVLAQAPCS